MNSTHPSGRPFVSGQLTSRRPRSAEPRMTPSDRGEPSTASGWSRAAAGPLGMSTGASSRPSVHQSNDSRFSAAPTLSLSVERERLRTHPAPPTGMVTSHPLARFAASPSLVNPRGDATQHEGSLGIMIEALPRLDEESKADYWRFKKKRESTGSLPDLILALSNTPLASVVVGVPGGNLANPSPSQPADGGTNEASGPQAAANSAPASAFRSADKATETRFQPMHLGKALQTIHQSSEAHHHKAADAVFLVRQSLRQLTQDANWLVPETSRAMSERYKRRHEDGDDDGRRGSVSDEVPARRPRASHSPSTMPRSSTPQLPVVPPAPDASIDARDEQEDRAIQTQPPHSHTAATTRRGFAEIPAGWLAAHTDMQKLSPQVIAMLRANCIDVPADLELRVTKASTKDSFNPAVRQRNMEILFGMRSGKVSDSDFLLTMTVLNANMKAYAVHTSGASLTLAKETVGEVNARMAQNRSGQASKYRPDQRPPAP